MRLWPAWRPGRAAADFGAAAGHAQRADGFGRITPDLEELEANLTNPPYGKFLEFGWRATLNRHGANDRFGPDTPLTLAGLTASPLCKDFSGNVVSYPFGRLNYGDLAPDYYHTIADPYGYFRQYDYGSCSAFLRMHRFVQVGLDHAAETQHAPGSFPVGTLDITTTSVRLLVASVLRGDTLQGADLARHPVLRTAGPDELQADLDAHGHVDTTVFGDHVTCPFHATWKLRIRIDGDPPDRTTTGSASRRRRSTVTRRFRSGTAMASPGRTACSTRL